MLKNMPSDDKTLATDGLISMKYITSNYHTASSEAANESLKKDLMDIYRDEQNNLSRLFSVMQNRGWYSPQVADSNQVNQVRQQYEAQSQVAFGATQPGVQPGVVQPGFQQGPRPGTAGNRPTV